MSSSFGHEIIGREVVDSMGEKLGRMHDLIIDIDTGDIMHMLVSIEADIDPAKLPWSMSDGLLRVPVEVIDRIAAKIHLRS